MAGANWGSGNREDNENYENSAGPGLGFRVEPSGATRDPSSRKKLKLLILAPFGAPSVLLGSFLP